MADIISRSRPVLLRRMTRGKIVVRDSRKNPQPEAAPEVVPGLSIESLKRTEYFTKGTAFELLTARIDDVSRLDELKKSAEEAWKAGEIEGAVIKGIKWQVPAESWYKYLDTILPQGGV